MSHTLHKTHIHHKNDLCDLHEEYHNMGYASYIKGMANNSHYMK